jgi:uncharacterized protein YutE (UPF0331/DUF86 family)
MIDRDLIIAKAGLIKKHISRIQKKGGKDIKSFIVDQDLQDIVSFNLHTAIQNCIDIAAHIIAEKGLGVPGSVSEMFYTLEENGFLSAEMTEKMIRAVGLRNLLLHEYGKIDLKRVFKVIHEDVEDLSEFLIEIFQKLEIL